MKILIGSDNYYPNVNGASYFSQRLAHYLQKRSHSVLVVAPSRTIHTGMTKINGINVFGLRSVPIFIYKDFRWTPSFFGRYDIKKIVREFNPDVIHIQDHFYICATLVRAAKKYEIPTLGTNHFMPENLTHYLHLPKTGERAVASMGWKYFRKIYGQLNAVTTPTKTAAELLKDIGLNLPVRALSCGIDRTRFKPENNPNEIKTKYHLPNTPTFLYVGRLDKEKQVDLLLRAFSKAIKKESGHFIIGGKGAEMENLRSLAKNLGVENNVTFTGFVSDEELPNLYCAANCFIISGIAELQSIVTMEAMASGLPVIAVNAMALPELVHHEENGYLFEIGDEEKVTEYMINILTDKTLRERMSKKSLEIIEKHDINTAIENYEKIYEELRKNY